MKFSLVALVLTVFCLWLTIQIPANLELALAYTLILTIGIIHGSNDLSLIQLLTRSNRHSRSLYLIVYLAIIIVMGVLFYILPLLALVVFIAFSCYHFGEQHFASKMQRVSLRVRFLYVAYGMFIFGLLFFLKVEDSRQIIQDLTNVRLSKVIFKGFLLTSFFLTLVGIIWNWSNFHSTFNILHELFLIIVFALIFQLASLLWAFAIYFIIWHSLPSLQDQIYSLYGAISKDTVIKYFKSSLINWVISLVGLVMIYRFSTYAEVQFVTFFFAFLAAITIPHVIVMYFLNKEA